MIGWLLDKIQNTLPYLLRNLDPVVALLCFGICLAGHSVILLFVTRGKTSLRQWIIGLVTAVYITALLSFTLLGRATATSSEHQSIFYSFVRLFDRRSDACYDVLLNVILFIPLGFLLRYRLRLPWACVVIVLCTLAIETTQYLLRRGSFQATDILANTLGGIAGVGLHRWVKNVQKELARKKRQAVCEAAEAEFVEESMEEK